LNQLYRKWIRLALVLSGAVLALRYLLPLAAPFIMGMLLALASEPAVRFLNGRCRLGRSLSTGIGVSLTFALLSLTVVTLCALLVRELGVLAEILPELVRAVQSGMDSLSAFLLELVQRAPEGMRGMLTGQIQGLFSDGSALLNRGMDFLLKLASNLLGKVPGGALTVATAILSAFMISGKLPAIRAFLKEKLPAGKIRPAIAVMQNLKTAIFGWLKAQLKLSGVTGALVLGGFLLLKIPYALLWAPMVALVDAVPVLGVGTVLIPWSLISFLQGDHFRAFALLGLYGAAALTRSVLEPRLVGRQLGLDPLVTLMALYIGYRLFGLPGMLLSPLLAVVTVQLAGSAHKEEDEK